MVVFEIRIQVDDLGQVMVIGPLDDQVKCYGLLEMAKDVVATHHAQARQRLVQLASGAVPGAFPAGGFPKQQEIT